MKGMQFTAEEKQLLVECLLFTASCDVCAEHPDRQRKRIVELAQRINDPSQKLYNIYIYETDLWDDKLTESIKKKFSNLPMQTVITD